MQQPSQGLSLRGVYDEATQSEPVIAKPVGLRQSSRFLSALPPRKDARFLSAAPSRHDRSRRGASIKKLHKSMKSG